jgi:hypothetical protein
MRTTGGEDGNFLETTECPGGGAASLLVQELRIDRWFFGVGWQDGLHLVFRSDSVVLNEWFKARGSNVRCAMCVVRCSRFECEWCE